MNLFGDIEDLEVALGKKVTKRILGSGSCSALVKLFPKNTDLAISHVTWNTYESMLRIYKRYNFTLRNNNNKGLCYIFCILMFYYLFYDFLTFVMKDFTFETK